MNEITFPLKLVFKLFGFATQIWVYDTNGAEVLYVYQRYFKIKEKIDIFNNRDKTQKLYQINADRIIDFSPKFSITDAAGNVLGFVKRLGWKSILKGYYEISDQSGNLKYKISEVNPIIKFLDGALGQVPIVGIFTGLFLHPEYAVIDIASNIEVARIKKSLALTERIFDITGLDNNLAVNDKALIANSLIMLALLQRKTG